MIDDDFKSELLMSVDGRSFIRISMEYKGEEFFEDVRIYWLGFTWGNASAKIKILRRILKYMDYMDNNNKK
jgi:hypothetical protein